jgi:hypothetical protein
MQTESFDIVPSRKPLTLPPPQEIRRAGALPLVPIFVVVSPPSCSMLALSGFVPVFCFCFLVFFWFWFF